MSTLETPRLILRRHKESDFSACAEMWGDPAVVRHIGGQPSTRQQSWSRILTYLGHWDLLGFGYWAIEERASGNFIGELGFADFKREISPSIEGTPEAGWVMSSAAQGKGYATEALLAALKWGDQRFAGERTVCLIHPENARSLHIARKVGFRELTRTTYKNEPTMLLERR